MVGLGTLINTIGSTLIFCVGVNLVWRKKLKVANMLPTIVIAVIWTPLPFGAEQNIQNA